MFSPAAAFDGDIFKWDVSDVIYRHEARHISGRDSVQQRHLYVGRVARDQHGAQVLRGNKKV